MKKVYANHLTDAPINPWSDEGRSKHLDIEVTQFILADFPLTDEERKQLGTDEGALKALADLFVEGLDWAYTAELAVESWRGRDSIFIAVPPAA